MFYEGIGSTPDNMMAGILALHEGYALSHAGFCDRLMQRLLESSDGPVSRLFAHDPFRGGPPPKLIRMVTIALEPTPKGKFYWREHVLSLHRPPTAASPRLWEDFCPAPELIHWDNVFFRKACAAHVGATAADAGGLAPSTAEVHRRRIAYDGVAPSWSTLEIPSRWIETEFWDRIVGRTTRGGLRDGLFTREEQRDWRSITACAARLMKHVGADELRHFEIVLSRLSLQLAARLAPVLWAPGWPRPSAIHPPEGAPAVASWFDMQLVCHHVIMLGKDAFEEAMAYPDACIAKIWPDGVATWGVVAAARAEIAAVHSAKGSSATGRSPNPRRSTSPKRQSQSTVPHGDQLTVQSAAFMHVLLWWPVFCWHATKWRLCQRMCSPWQLAVARDGAGVLELVDIVAHFLPPPGAQTADHGGDEGENYPALHQGNDMLWRDESGRLIGLHSQS